ncbi:MAG: flavodoxin family protein [Thermosipho sp. (in: Bacteria)]|nr:flavodoxin family protein [Thermosipho sp. (in: thermotogales)]
MKKVLVINGSARKGRTYQLLKNIVEKLPYESEIVNLKDFNINECLGCEVCIKKDYCVIKDEAELLMNKIKKADGLIIGTPVYIENVSGLLKKFLDRTCRWYHRPPLIGKPVLLVATTAGSSLNFVLRYLENITTTWGMVQGGKIGRRISQSRIVKEQEVKSFIKAMEGNSTKYIGINKLFRFQVQKAMASNLMEIDKKYWKENNLIKKTFYYKYFTDPFSYILAVMFGKFLSKQIRKNARKVKEKGLDRAI